MCIYSFRNQTIYDQDDNAESAVLSAIMVIVVVVVIIVHRDKYSRKKLRNSLVS